MYISACSPRSIGFAVTSAQVATQRELHANMDGCYSTCAQRGRNLFLRVWHARRQQATTSNAAATLQHFASVVSLPQASVRRRYSTARSTEYTLTTEDKFEIVELCNRFDQTLNMGKQETLAKFFHPEAALNINLQVMTPLQHSSSYPFHRNRDIVRNQQSSTATWLTQAYPAQLIPTYCVRGHLDEKIFSSCASILKSAAEVTVHKMLPRPCPSMLPREC